MSKTDIIQIAILSTYPKLGVSIEDALYVVSILASCVPHNGYSLLLSVHRTEYLVDA